MTDNPKEVKRCKPEGDAKHCAYPEEQCSGCNLDKVRTKK
jgi:hypothetical protein